MKKDQLLTTISLFHRYSGISTVVFQEKKIIFSTYEAKKIDDISILSFLSDWKPSTNLVTMISYNSLELYGLFQTEVDSQTTSILIGPVISARPLVTENYRYFSFYSMHSISTITDFLNLIPRLNQFEFSEYLSLFFYTITNIQQSSSDIVAQKYVIIASVEGDDYQQPIILDEPRENILRKTYDEIGLYADAIRKGDLKQVERLFQKQVLYHQFYSSQPKQNLYNLISLSALLGKVAVDTGLDFLETASVGSTMISLAEGLTTPSDFVATFKKMVLGYCNQIEKEIHNDKYSKSIKKAVNYIDKHVHDPLSLEDIAKYVKLSRPYLSQLFSKEVGISLQTYIQNRKIKESENLIRYTKMPIAEIASSLSYCSQSYFTEVFKKQMGLTPLEYRKKTLSQ